MNRTGSTVRIVSATITIAPGHGPAIACQMPT
jgi:hypothetical protein